MPPFVPYLFPRISEPLSDDWEPSPYNWSQRRLLGRFWVVTRSWRRRDGGASIEFASAGHMRLVRVDLGAVVENAARGVLWAQGLDPGGVTPMQRSLPGGTASGFEAYVDPGASGGLIPGILAGVAGYGQRRLLVLGWSPNGVSSCSAVGASTTDHASDVDAVLAGLTYDEVRFPAFA